MKDKKTKTVQIKITDVQKKNIERFIGQESAKHGVLYTTSSYLLKVIMNYISGSMNSD